MSKRPVIWAAVMSAYDISGAATTTKYFATRGFTTSGVDTPANIHFEERVVRKALDIPARTMWSDGGTFGRMKVGSGSLTLANGDGALDYLLGYGLDGREIAIYRGYEGDAFPGSWTKYVYTMDVPEDGLKQIRIGLKEKPLELDTPFQTTLYTGTGDLGGGVEISGKPRPYLLGGPAFNVPAVLVNATKNIYQVSSEALTALNDVRDGGVSLGKAPSSWSAETSGTANGLNDIAYGNGVLVAVGDSGTIIWSDDDGATWTAATTPSFSTTNIHSVAYSPSLTRWVAGGESGTLAYSDDDGDTWTQITAGSNPFGGTETIHDIAWGAEAAAFVAVGSLSVVASSANGTAFTSRTVSFAGSVNTVTFGGGLFVAAAASSEIETSPDGTTWTSRTLDFTSAGDWFSSAYGRGRYVLAGDKWVITSQDGVTWTPRLRLDEGLGSMDGAVFSTTLNQFVAVGDSDRAVVSPDGVTWDYVDIGSGVNLFGVADTGTTVAVTGGSGKISTVDGSGTYASEANLLDDSLKPAYGTYKVYLAGGYFRLGSPAISEITCDPVAGASASDRTHAQLFVDALTEAGKTAGAWSASDITAADSANASVATVWIGPDERPTTAEVIDRIAQSCGAWWGTDAAGVYRFQIVTAPSGTADAELGRNDIKALSRLPERGALRVPPYQTVVQYQKNYRVQTTGIGFSVSDADRALYAAEWRVEKSTDGTVQTEHITSGEFTVDSVYATSTGVSTEASRVQTLRGTERQRYELRVEDDDVLCALDLNDVPNITYPRFDLTSGKKFRIISVKPEPGTGFITLEVWG